MRRKSMSKKVIALTLLATMVAPQVAYGKEITKDEAVYVTMDPGGKVDKRIVSNWVHSNNGGDIKDKSILKDIKNVKGDEKPTISGENITWSVKGNDVYYQGTTDKELPLSIKVKYCLDGKEIAPEDIAGKSGKFKISIDFINNETHNVAINGEVKTIYTPIAAAAVVNLPDKYFKNIKTSSGSIVSDGNNNIVTLAALPGMKKSLGLDDLDLDLGIDLKDSIDIEGDVDNFQLGAIMVTATPKLGELKELSNVNKVEDLKKALGDLKDASTKLADGGKKLSDVVNLASSKLQDGMKQLNSEENKKKLALMTDENKVNLSRKLVNDALTMEKMDTSLLESTSGLMTKDNLALGNKVYKDVNEIKFENVLKTGLIQKVEKFTSNGNFDKNLQALNDLLGDKALLDSQITPEKLNSLYGLLELLTNNIDGLQSIMKTSLTMSQADLSSLGAVNGLLSKADAINAKLDAVSAYAKELATLKGTLDGMTKQVNVAAQGAKALDSNKAAADSIIKIISSIPDSQLPKDQKDALVKYMGGSKAFIGQMAASLPQTEAFMQGASAKLDGVNKELSSEQNTAMIAQLKALMAKENIQKIQGMLQGLEQSQKLLKDNAKTLGALNQVAGSVKKEDLIKVKTISTKLMGDLQRNKDNVDLLMTSLGALKDPSTIELFNKLKVVQGDLKALEPTMKYLNSNMTPENVNKLMATPDMLKQLLDMKQDLVKSDDILNTTKEALAQGNVDKAKNLLSKAPELLKGVNELSNGANMLSDNLSKFNTEGVGKLNSEGTEKLDKVKKVADSANELVKISNDYGAFSGIADNMDSKVKFIYKTQEIKGKEIKQEVKEEKKEEKKGFFSWIKSAFSK